MPMTQKISWLVKIAAKINRDPNGFCQHFAAKATAWNPEADSYTIDREVYDDLMRTLVFKTVPTIGCSTCGKPAPAPRDAREQLVRIADELGGI